MSLRLWTLSSQCRPMAPLVWPACKRAAPLDAMFFSTTSTQVSLFARRVSPSLWLRHSWKTPGSQATSLFSLAGHFLSRRTFASRLSQSSQSRVNWRGRGSIPPYGGSPPPGRGRKPSFFSKLQHRFNLVPFEVVFWSIIGLNGAVYFAWQYAADQVRNGNPSLYVKMYKNILLSWRNIREGRIWTIITSTFSHSSASHIFMNGLTFYFMAPPIMRLLGNSAFMSLYLLGGISCSVLSLLLNQSLIKREASSNGASGAIFAVMSFFACVSPQTKFLIFFVVPVPAWAVITGLFVWDGLSAISDRRTQVDGAGHVGGILAGVAYYLLKRRTFFF